MQCTFTVGLNVFVFFFQFATLLAILTVVEVAVGVLVYSKKEEVRGDTRTASLVYLLTRAGRIVKIRNVKTLSINVIVILLIKDAQSHLMPNHIKLTWRLDESRKNPDFGRLSDRIFTPKVAMSE